LPPSAFDREQISTCLSHLLYKLQLTRHFGTVINYTVMHATWRGGWELWQHQQPVVRCGVDPGVSECTVHNWLQWWPATRHVGSGSGKMVTRAAAL